MPQRTFNAVDARQAPERAGAPASSSGTQLERRPGASFRNDEGPEVIQTIYGLFVCRPLPTHSPR